MPASAPAAATLAAAKNEYEAFHVVISGEASGVSLSLDALSDGQGHDISGRDIVLYREALIEVAVPTGGDGQAGAWPDALIPDVDPIAGEKRNAFPFDVPAEESRAVLVDIHVPAGYPAGLYRGALQVSGSVTATVPISLTVWDFEIPSTSTLKSAFGLAWNGPCMGHGDGSCSNGEAEQQLRARYVRAALDNRISIYAPSYTSSVDANGDGSWTEYDQYVGPFLDGTADTRLRGAKLTAVAIQGELTTPLVAAWSRHFADKGWSGALFNYLCDEPPRTCEWIDIGTRAGASRAADESIPLLVTTTLDEARANGQDGNINLFAPLVNCIEGKEGTLYSGNQRSKYAANLWWYQSCMSFGCASVGPGYDAIGNSGWPTYAIDSDATRNRAQEWMSYSYDMQGELYYETTQAYFSGDPWTNQYNFGGAGDGNLFYPGTTDRIGGKTEIPVESLRMKAIRDGMEDYELLALAKNLGLGAEALQIAQGLFPSAYLSTTTPEAIDAARAELARLVLRALGK